MMIKRILAATAVASAVAGFVITAPAHAESAPAQADTSGIIVVGLSTLEVTDINVDLIGNFDFKIAAPGAGF